MRFSGLRSKRKRRRGTPPRRRGIGNPRGVSILQSSSSAVRKSASEKPRFTHYHRVGLSSAPKRKSVGYPDPKGHVSSFSKASQVPRNSKPLTNISNQDMNPNPSGYRIASPAPSDSLPMFRTAPAAQQPLRNKNRMSKKFGLESLFVAVVGRGFREENQDGLVEGQSLYLRHERYNPHDRNAVAVHNASSRLQIGYLERSLAAIVCHLLKHTNFLLEICSIPMYKGARLPCVLRWKSSNRNNDLLKPLRDLSTEQARMGTTWRDCLTNEALSHAEPKENPKNKKNSKNRKYKQRTLFSPLFRVGFSKSSKQTSTSSKAKAIPIPVPILNHIFYYVNALQDYAVCRTVCRKWLGALNGFMPNKMIFLSAITRGSKKDPKDFVELLRSIGKIKFGLSKVQEKHLLKRAINSRTLSADDVKTLKRLFKTKSELLFGRESAPNIAVLTWILLTVSTKKLPLLLNALTSNLGPNAPPRHVVSDLLYYIARITLSPCFEEPNHRSGYDLICWLRKQSLEFPLFEGSVRLTGEQASVVTKELTGKKILKVVACAGSGKTTLLRAYARARPDSRFLYLAYNASVGAHAKKTFPKNVTCANIHKLAYQRIGYKYQKKLRGDFSFTGNDLTRERLVQMVVQNYLSSADDEIEQSHVDNTVPEKSRNSANFLKLSRAYWEQMRDLDDKKVHMTHDGYLKIYQLSRDDLSRKFDVIFLDEAQDSNDVVCSILMKQNIPKLIVGDPHQRIYSFLGGKGAFTRLPADYSYKLTQSFRFGSNLAYFASRFLTANDSNSLVIGTTRETKIEILPEEPEAYPAWSRVRHTCICRTNVQLFDEAVEFVSGGGPWHWRKPKLRERALGFVGGIDGYNFNAILDVFHLINGSWKEIKTNKIKRFAKRDHNPEVVFAQLKEYSKATEDKELLGACRIVLRHKQEIPQLINRIHATCVKDCRQAFLTVTTAHKAKGLEWERVRLSEAKTPCEWIPRLGGKRSTLFMWQLLEQRGLSGSHRHSPDGLKIALKGSNVRMLKGSKSW
ncbi:hypothetical protein AAMO2058_000674500 [Amorphochlora amoebiformis]